MSNCECGISARTVVVSLFVGAIAGGAAVLLLAPKARRESAERIRELSHELKGRASETIDVAKEKVSSTVSEAIDMAEEKVSSTVARGKEFLDEKRAVATSAVKAGKEAYARREG